MFNNLFLVVMCFDYRRSVFIFNISGRYDVGNLESYIACNEQYKAVY